MLCEDSRNLCETKYVMAACPSVYNLYSQRETPISDSGTL